METYSKLYLRSTNQEPRNFFYDPEKWLWVSFFTIMMVHRYGLRAPPTILNSSGPPSESQHQFRQYINLSGSRTIVPKCPPAFCVRQEIPYLPKLTSLEEPCRWILFVCFANNSHNHPNIFSSIATTRHTYGWYAGLNWVYSKGTTIP